MNLFSIDHGNEYIKTLHNIFPSAVSVYDYEPPMANEWVYFNDRYYCLSNDTKGYLRDKTVDETYLILTMFALAKEKDYIDIKEPVDFAVDLPPLHYGALKDRFAQYIREGFDGEKSFTYHRENDTIITVKANSVQVFPQGFAAVVAYLPHGGETPDDILAKHKDFLLIDIGGYTVDVIPFEDGFPVPERSATRETGILRMCGFIKDSVTAKCARQVSVRDIQRVARNEETMLEPEIAALIKSKLDEWSRDIVLSSGEKVEDLSSMPVVFTGGGARLLKPYLCKCEALKTYTFITDQKANVRGCAMLARMRKGK